MIDIKDVIEQLIEYYLVIISCFSTWVCLIISTAAQLRERGSWRQASILDV